MDALHYMRIAEDFLDRAESNIPQFPEIAIAQLDNVRLALKCARGACCGTCDEITSRFAKEITPC